MRLYKLWQLDENGCPIEIRVSRYGDLEEQRQYRDTLQKQHPKKAYWITDSATGIMVL